MVGEGEGIRDGVGDGAGGGVGDGEGDDWVLPSASPAGLGHIVVLQIVRAKLSDFVMQVPLTLE